jgi:hypothetical protein
MNASRLAAGREPCAREVRGKGGVMSRTLFAISIALFTITAAGCFRARRNDAQRPYGAMVVGPNIVAPMAVPALTDWRTDTRRSALTGTENFVAATSPPQSYRDFVGEDHYPLLIVACEDNQLRVGIKIFSRFAHETIEYERDARWTSVTMRIGQSPPETARLRIHTDDVSAFFEDPSVVLDRIASSSQATMAVQFTPTRVGAVTAEFQLGPADRIAAQARSACGQ